MRIKVTAAEILGGGEERIKKLRQDAADLPALLGTVGIKDRRLAIVRGMMVVDSVQEGMDQLGLSMKGVEAGHGYGHFKRDFVNAMRLAARMELPPEQIFIGFTAGALHDVGCALVPRYDDAHRLVRHAEASALLLEHVLADSAYIERAELTLLMYAVAAHTHYLRPTDVKDKNGEPVGVIHPYPDMAGDKPFYPVWLARWADRLDTNGPCHVGRHYFTLVKEHHDFDGKNFYTLDFEGQMRPLIRTDEERGKDARTMAEHLLMYAGSQNNASPYGKHDFGEMVRLRDSYRRRLELIVREMIQPKEYSDIERRKILESWNRFLTGNIEPSDRGLHAAEKLARMFNDLPREAAGAWAHVFRRCLQQYLAWSAEAVFDLTEISREFGMHFDRETYLTLVPAFEID